MSLTYCGECGVTHDPVQKCADAGELQCPLKGCPATIRQTSDGFSCNSYTCDNGHTFGLWNDSLFDEDEA